MGHRVVIRHIVKRIGIIKRVDIIVEVVLRHFVCFAILKVVEDGFLSNFIW